VRKTGRRWPTFGWQWAIQRRKVNLKQAQMNIFDLTKATVVCGSTAFLVYSFPVISQAAIIGLLTVFWLSYAYKLAKSIRER
jgi:hypothetical protein